MFETPKEVEVEEDEIAPDVKLSEGPEEGCWDSDTKDDSDDLENNP